MQHIYLVKCKFCGNDQKMATNKVGTVKIVKKYSYKKVEGFTQRKIKEVQEPTRIMKKCVYCGRRFCAYQHIGNHQIIKQLLWKLKKKEISV